MSLRDLRRRKPGAGQREARRPKGASAEAGEQSQWSIALLLLALGTVRFGQRNGGHRGRPRLLRRRGLFSLTQKISKQAP